MTQPKRWSTTRIVLTVVGGVLALCLVGGGITAYFVFRSINDAIKPSRQATEAFIGDLERGDAASAYGKLCSSARESVTQEQFATMVSSRRPTTHKVVGAHVQNNSGVVTATVTADLTYQDGFTDHHMFELKKEGGAWKVCGNPY